ncbi:MAG: HEPN domain-containing protein [Candidatus Magasanikbacteria bacterium]|nr:HEPN domain-containing protein [Candidatus Magasanikbacteria bacterium]
MNIEYLKNYCYVNSDRKWETAKSLFKSGKYSDCLFYAHLALELLFKEKYLENKRHLFPITHDLERLAFLSDIKLPGKYAKHLIVINTFNIAARYDDFKFSFYKKATKKFAQKYFRLTREIILWLKKYTPLDK